MRRVPLATKLVLVGIGGGAAVLWLGNRRPPRLPPWDPDDQVDDWNGVRPPRQMADNLDVDPGDPVQALDEVPPFHSVELEVDAHTRMDLDEDLDLAEAESQAEAESMRNGDAYDPDASPPTLDALEAEMHGTGDLYGVHTPPALDRDHPHDDVAMEEGQNWVETLQTSAIENGAIPELELDDIVDDADIERPPHASDVRDRPVADRGSGGPGGV